MKNTQSKGISIKKVAERMDNVVEKIIDPENKDYTVPVGVLLVKEMNAYLAMYRLQLDAARLAGKQVENPILDMD